MVYRVPCTDNLQLAAARPLNASAARRADCSVQKARLLTRDRVEPLVSLYDAVVLFYGDGIITITGMARDPLTRKVTAQSWYIEIVEVGK